MVRFKNRYLLCELKWEDGKYDPRIKNKDIYDALREAVATNFGDLGSAEIVSSLGVRYWNPVTSLVVIRVARDHHRKLWAALSLTSHIKARRVRPKVLHSAGTIRTVERKAAFMIRDWLGKAQSVIERKRRELQASDMILELQQLTN